MSAVPPPHDPARFSLAAHVLAKAAAQPDKIALQILRLNGAERWSYGRLEAAVRGVATGFRQAGLCPGDRVLMRLGNTVEFPLCFLGAIAAGVVPVPTSAQLTAPEVTRIAGIVAPAAVVAAGGVPLPDGDFRVIPDSDLRAWESLPPAGWHLGDAGRMAYAVCTSGTSGQPRAVAHAHRAILARAMMHQGWYGLTGADRLLHSGAFNWTYTLGTGLLDPWTVGATALIPATGIEPAQLPLLMKRFDATIFASSPGIYRIILKDGARIALPRLRHGLSAGESLSPGLRARWQAATGTPVHEAFGMTECSTFVSGSPSRPAPQGAMGYPQQGRRIAVLANGTPAPAGEPGELAIHRSDPGLFLGYIGAEEETKSRFLDDWFLTGDSVSEDADGAIRYLGRVDDMMNAGGYRVSPIEVEAAMAGHPGAGEVAATDLRVKEDVTVIGLFYTGAARPEDLAAHAAACLARYKQPRIFQPVATLPLTATGKVNRRVLRQEWKPTS